MGVWTLGIVVIVWQGRAERDTDWRRRAFEEHFRDSINGGD
jgi:hypothetical protein